MLFLRYSIVKLLQRLPKYHLRIQLSDLVNQWTTARAAMFEPDILLKISAVILNLSYDYLCLSKKTPPTNKELTPLTKIPKKHIIWTKKFSLSYSLPIFQSRNKQVLFRIHTAKTAHPQKLINSSSSLTAICQSQQQP